MSSSIAPRLFARTISNGATAFCPVPIHQGCVGLHISWPDATTNVTITFETSSFGPEDATPELAANARLWPAFPGVTITQTPGAPGAVLVNISGVRQKRGRLRIVAGAASELEIYDGIVDT